LGVAAQPNTQTLPTESGRRRDFDDAMPPLLYSVLKAETCKLRKALQQELGQLVGRARAKWIPRQYCLGSGYHPAKALEDAPTQQHSMISGGKMV